MANGGTIFLDVTLPNAATWFYTTLVLAVALFFQFRRPFSLRNLDVLLLFLLVLPLLYLREAQETRKQLRSQWEERGAHVTMLLEAGCNLARAPTLPAPAPLWMAPAIPPPGEAYPRGYRGVWRAYLFLLIGTTCLLLRSMIDLGLRKRSLFKPNLSGGGLLWLAVALYVVMMLKTFFPQVEPLPQAESRSLLLDLLLYLLPWPRPAWEAGVALGAHGLVIVGLIYIGSRHFQDFTLGVAAAVFYLLLPYTAFHLAETHHVAPALCFIAAVAFYRRPGLAGVCLGLATSVSYFPMLLLPLWASFYFRRGMKWFLLGVFGVVGLFLCLILIDRGLQEAAQLALQRAEWQAWKFATKPQSESLWTDVAAHSAYRLPLFVAHLLLMVASVFWPHPKNLGHVLAWSITLILGVQFWYADAGGIYVLWYLPLLVLLAFRPTLTDCVPPTVPDPWPMGHLVQRAVVWLRRKKT